MRAQPQITTYGASIPPLLLPPIVISGALLLSVFYKHGQSHHGSQGEGGGHPTMQLFPFFLLFLKPEKKRESLPKESQLPAHKKQALSREPRREVQQKHCSNME